MKNLFNSFSILDAVSKNVLEFISFMAGRKFMDDKWRTPGKVLTVTQLPSCTYCPGRQRQMYDAKRFTHLLPNGQIALRH